MGGGVLPVAYHDGEVYFLFSRERLALNKSKDRGKWSDFGGSTEQGETQYQTAVREAEEESSGILGTSADIRRLIKRHLAAKISDREYGVWVVEVKYDESIPAVFREHFRAALRKTPDVVKARNGLFEKDKLRWIRLKDLRGQRHIIRPWYRRFIPKLIRLFQE